MIFARGLQRIWEDVISVALATSGEKVQRSATAEYRVASFRRQDALWRFLRIILVLFVGAHFPKWIWA